MDGGTYSTVTAYDSAGRIGAVTYPSSLGVTYTYNTIGYLTQISGGAPNVAFWTANAYDAEAHLTQATFGNSIVTNKVYNPDTGRIATIKAGPSDTVQNLGFTFNTLGNLTQRVDAVTQSTLREQHRHQQGLQPGHRPRRPRHGLLLSPRLRAYPTTRL